eukprot:4290455-Prymnesium_polylepis.1
MWNRGRGLHPARSKSRPETVFRHVCLGERLMSGRMSALAVRSRRTGAVGACERVAKGTSGSGTGWRGGSGHTSSKC